MRVNSQVAVLKKHKDFATSISHTLQHTFCVQLNTSYVCNPLKHTETLSFNTGNSVVMEHVFFCSGKQS